MKIEFNELNDQAKTWVYTSSVKITDNQKQQIVCLSDQFLSNWESHGNKVFGYVEVIEDHFVLIAADPKGDTLCGRAVDANISFIKEVQEVTGLNLTDRMVVVYKQHGKLVSTDFNTIKQEIKLGVIAQDSIIYNPLVTTVKEYNTSFKQEPESCWII